MLKDAEAKKRIELAVTGISVVILIFLVTSHMSKPGSGKGVSKNEAYHTSESAMTIVSEPESWDKLRWGRDPFLLDASTNSIQEQDVEDLALNGIMSDKQNPYAIINNDVVKLGDKVGGMTVIEINENNVVLDENGERHTLELNLY
ncbi:MAG: hypothetical protein CO035_05090 [Candidatus Omnitrophica bacterium CG_4_9_14_0_2_um_filter_42_8]|nr:MAG: hypothetical protein COW92_00095 [Candidatus Omnitrophica bacterium CG22_combo_CG10-13_8_21_14_all_43_16]PJC48143.1 MAG: hypothetical protein CO035_05090 [Candidatus Omnitrophica bacterium CG_4_9_14_0_2_um_filter_42_8]